MFLQSDATSAVAYITWDDIQSIVSFFGNPTPCSPGVEGYWLWQTNIMPSTPWMVFMGQDFIHIWYLVMAWTVSFHFLCEPVNNAGILLEWIHKTVWLADLSAFQRLSQIMSNSLPSSKLHIRDISVYLLVGEHSLTSPGSKIRFFFHL